MTRIHIDRKPELDLFQNILEGRRTERILLVEAPPGRGKTLLLMEYQKMAVQAGVPCAALDLRTGSLGIHDVLAAMPEEWGWKHFPTFRHSVEGMLRPAAEVTVSGILQIGRPQVRVVPGQEEREVRRWRQRTLTDALFQDLGTWLGSTGRAILFVDTYNPEGDPQTVEPELQEWLEGVFLGHARRCTGLVVVIAGQKAPSPNIAWERCCHRLYLAPLDNPDDWMDLVRVLDLKLSRRDVSLVCRLYRGEPLGIATGLGKLRDWGGSQ
ncbi:MAG: hypothetical protein ACP5OO_10090 [Chloroflexia bacterium]